MSSAKEYRMRITTIQTRVHEVKRDILSGSADVAYCDTEAAAVVAIARDDPRSVEAYLSVSESTIDPLLKRLHKIDHRLEELSGRLPQHGKNLGPRMNSSLDKELRALEQEVTGYVPQGRQIAEMGRYVGDSLSDVREFDDEDLRLALRVSPYGFREDEF